MYKRQAASGAVKTYVPLPVPADIAVDAAIGSLELPKRKAGWDKPPIQEDVQVTEEEPTFVMARYGCGSGCLVRNLQLSEPEVIEDDWLRVEVLSQVWVSEFDAETDTWTGKQRNTRDGPPESKGWWFAQCEEGLFTSGKNRSSSRLQSRASLSRTETSKVNPRARQSTPRFIRVGSGYAGLGLVCPELVGNAEEASYNLK